MSKQPKPGLLPTSTQADQRTVSIDDEDNNRGVLLRSHDQGLCNIARHRFLSQAEWLVIAHGVGAVQDTETQTRLHPVSWWWPPKGLPRGLYRDVVYQRTKSFYIFKFVTFARWVLMIMQLFLGASLTGLGSFSLEHGTPITVLGAANTIIAGLLAYLHNSGLPDRYGYDMAEFGQVEDHIREVLDSAMVPANHTIDQALAECFDLYQHAKATVLANKPVTYTTSRGLQGKKHSVPTAASTPSSKAQVELPNAKGQGGGCVAEAGK
ncbi:hypothetical protein B0J13DRAFT_622436 [Dactylonectria estremocensis]|uniref:SMODS and SLOG-associating 2TM effector domain-containing protein n=1 Tax=Dactylonectria estremocensis TaxID=1079267 RepID=A0A9P9ERL1_9HYPO|nr:hypothetical protein B0J13DRAFT_622436 [Dactylonectria estremocensis]